MALRAEIGLVRGRPMLLLNGEPTGEFWCFGDPNAIADFTAAQIRICQFPVPSPSWWTGENAYDFAALDSKVRAFLRGAPRVLLMPRVTFGFRGEGWWARAHPEEISCARNLNGDTVPLPPGGSAIPVECLFSAGSTRWADDAGEALGAFVTRCESMWPDNIIGYQIGGGISAEWFRWWNFAEDVYEDYSPAAVRFFREFLRQRYGHDAALQQAWQRPDVTLAEVEVPAPQQLHRPQLGFFRDPARERAVIDWLDCLSTGNAGQLMHLAAAAKGACEGAKLVGAFFGYFWPHWNTQNPARSGHLHLSRLVNCPDIDFISCPYHYDNRGVTGVHHAQTVPQTIERAGKLHLTEIDTATHLTRPEHRGRPWFAQAAKNRAESLAMLRRDAASVLGTAGTGWWMDLRLERWYADVPIQATVAALQQLAQQLGNQQAPSHAEVALVIDDESYAYCSLHSPLNQFFTALPRQCLWSDLGFPLDTLLLSEVGQVRRYRVYVFLNAWHVGPNRRSALLHHIRQPGVTAIWFYGAGFLGGPEGDAGTSDLVGMRIKCVAGAARPEIELLSDWRERLGHNRPGEAIRYGARLDGAVTAWLLRGESWRWDVEVSPYFVVEDPRVLVLGHYTATAKVGLAVLEKDGWSSVYSAAPLLPGALLRAVAEGAGVHLYTPTGCSVRHRGPLLSVTASTAGTWEVSAPAGGELIPLHSDAATGHDDWQTAASPTGIFAARAGQTQFFWCHGAER